MSIHLSAPVVYGPITEREDDARAAGIWAENEYQTLKAFSAIRRAVTLARRHADEAALIRQMHGHPAVAAAHGIQADTIRHAIRAAIGSPKA